MLLFSCIFLFDKCSRVIHGDFCWLNLLRSILTKRSHDTNVFCFVFFVRKKNEMAVSIFGTSCSKQWSIQMIRTTDKKRALHLYFSRLLVAQKLLTKKRLRVNTWLLLYVYVLPTGYSKIGLVPAGQLSAQREHVLLRQALFGQTLVTNGRLEPCVIAHEDVLSSGFGVVSSNKTKLCLNTQSRSGSFQFLWLNSLNVEYKKKSTKKKTSNNSDFVDFALVDYLSVHAYHHFYM